MLASEHDKNRDETRGLLIQSGVALRLPRIIDKLFYAMGEEGDKTVSSSLAGTHYNPVLSLAAVERRDAPATFNKIHLSLRAV